MARQYPFDKIRMCIGLLKELGFAILVCIISNDQNLFEWIFWVYPVVFVLSALHENS